MRDDDSDDAVTECFEPICLIDRKSLSSIQEEDGNGKLRG